MLAEMHEWPIRLRVATASGSGLARAIDYSSNRWPSLIRYAQTGNLPIDNNPMENVIRPIAIGKKLVVCRLGASRQIGSRDTKPVRHRKV